MHSENELALYVEGDLPPDKASEVDVHLVPCVLCRELVEELRETQSVFKSMKQEAVSPQALAQLRARVLGEVAARNLRPGWGRWVYALAGVGIVLAVALGVVTRYRHSAANVQQVVQRQSVERQLIERHSPPFQGGVAAPKAQTGWLASDNHVPNHPGATSFDASPYRARASRHPSLERRGIGMTQPAPQKPAEQPKEIMVKLLTDDPNVVIYWLVDQNGGGF
jgi:hypothetical protein